MLRFYESKTIVENFSKDRPNYPPEITKLALGDLKGMKLDLLVDVGCGSGNSLKPFAPYFRKVLAIDPSENQIEKARSQNKFPHVTYQVGFAEKLPCEDESVDVITTGGALHWFDRPKFYKEVTRVLKPGGRLVAFNYPMPKLIPTNLGSSIKISNLETDLLAQFVTSIAKSSPLKQEPEQIILSGYSYILNELPFVDKQKKETLYSEYTWRLDDVKRYIWSDDIYETFMKNKEDEFKHLSDAERQQKLSEEDMAEVFCHMLRKSWNCLDVTEADLKIKAIFEFCTIVANK